jgi:nicotinate-nucleotide pyrophosphorylase (carboxylating)
MLQSPLIDKLIALAIEEDLALGDVTSESCIPEGHQSIGKVLVRESLVVCGLPLIERIALSSHSSLKVTCHASDGDAVEKETVIAELQGSTRSLLALERTILNFLQRLSGVASQARLASAAAGSLIVLDTRKTTPGWRVLEKYACRIGGAKNHRFSLGDMVLVKNNHVDVQPGASVGDKMRAALSQIAARKGPYLPMEVEVRSREELEAALEFKPQMIMLDNMTDERVAESVRIVKQKSPETILEASGGISTERLTRLAALGVHSVSMGALTTKAQNKDISLRISSL